MIPEIPEDVMKRINELRKDQMTPEDRDLIQKHEAAILAMTSEQRFELCLNGAKEYQLSLKSYFKEHAPAAVDEHGEMDIVKCREHLESLAKRKDLTDYEVVLVMEHSQGLGLELISSFFVDSSSLDSDSVGLSITGWTDLSIVLARLMLTGCLV